MTELAAVARFVHVAAAVLLAGNFSFDLFVARPALRHGNAESALSAKFLRLRSRFTYGCLIAILASGALVLWLQTGLLNEIVNAVAVLTLLRETHYGRVWVGRMLVAGALLIVVALQSSRPSKRSLVPDSVVSAALLGSLALAGHSAAGEGATLMLQIGADALHLVCSGIWLGGLIPLAVFLQLCSPTTEGNSCTLAGAAVRRFSALALGCVTIIIATGTINAWNLVGGFAPLFGTLYGKLLLLKIGLLLPLLALAALNLLRLKPQLTEANSSDVASTSLRKLRRNVMLEAVFGAMILLIVGFMGVTPPARHVQPDWPFSWRLDWGALENMPKARVETQRGIVWIAIGGVAMISAVVRRRRRIAATLIGVGALAYGGRVAVEAISTDAYPTTYKRPQVAYHAISIANGGQLYEDNGCGSCHGSAGYGDGPLAEDLRPKPADLTAPHANTHTAGDLFWWISHGVPSTAMPGYEKTLSDEERWDLINFMRALATGDRARSLAPIIEEEPWLVAPDFAYVTRLGEAKTLRDHRSSKIVLLVLLDVNSTERRLNELTTIAPALQSANVEIIVIPHFFNVQNAAERLPALMVFEGIREITETYKLFARSFSDEGLVSASRHVEFLIDKQGYIRARWLPAENAGWRNEVALLREVGSLNKEKPRAPPPEDHVH